MKKVLLLFMLMPLLKGYGQVVDGIVQPAIHSVKLYQTGNPLSYPVLNLGSNQQLELHFDDLDGDVKNYYYTFQHCNADWTPSNLFTIDYIRGFQNTRITNYRNSSIANIRYTHYQASLPDRSSVPVKSGNYLLKVFVNNDTANLYFTKRFLVIDNKVSVAALLRQPFSSELFLSDQRIQVNVNTAAARINVMSPQDLKLVVLQNYSWPTAVLVDKPTIYRGNYFEYNDEAISFPSGREWRWLDLRSMRLMGDRVAKIEDKGSRTDIYVKTETERRQQVYLYYKDINGLYTIENADGNNPFWQSDYGYVHFSFMPPGGQAYPGKDLYLYGELTNYLPDENARMEFNAEKGVYEKTLYLKQGYYNYAYFSMDIGKRSGNRFSFENTEGNFNNTENDYMVLIYFRPFGARADELIGYANVNSYGR